MEWAWLIPALSFIAFGLIILIGRFLPGRGAPIAVLAIGAGFILFWFVLGDYLSSGPNPEPPLHWWLFSVEWFNVATVSLKWGIIIDPLTVLMLGIVTFVALVVQVYSLEYMRGQPRYGWYFAAHSLFAASMLTLVLADNFLLLYIAWELVGLCSYLLIGFWYERRSAAEAAKKAFVTTRIGDVCLLIGIILLFKATGTFDMSTIFQAVEAGDVSGATVTAAAVLIFLGAMGKSAQFPFHVWLPDAMEGPSPVSALIHAATMVVAGVFLVARAFPLFEAAPAVLILVAAIGLFTAIIAATMALVTTDIKRILAYSTVSHLGFMMLALGAGGVAAGMFHLLGHAMAKAMLFLCAGSIMHAMKDETNINKMGGLRRKMPITAITFAVGALSLAGIPPLSGFFTKDEVFAAVWRGLNPIFALLFLAAAFLSALYMARVLFVTFFGKAHEEAEHAHEAPFAMAGPLLALAVPAAIVGLLTFSWASGYGGFGTFIIKPGDVPEPYHFKPGLAVASIVVVMAGFGLGWAIYGQRRISAEMIQQRYATAHRVLVNKYYIDHAYQWCIDRVVLVFSSLVALFDRIVVNDTGVNGTGLSVILSGLRLRYLQSGRLYNYALGMVIGVVALALLWWLWDH